MSNDAESRTVTSPAVGTKIALIVAACFLAVAVYFYVTPTMFMGKDALFGCGSPLSPHTDVLGKSQCHLVENQAAHRAYLFAGLAVLLAALGALFFGTSSSAQGRADRVRLDEDDDDTNGEAPREPRRGVLAGRTERAAASERSGSRRPRRLGEEDEEDFDEPRDRRGRSRFEDDEDDAPTMRRNRFEDDEESPMRRSRRSSADDIR